MGRGAHRYKERYTVEGVDDGSGVRVLSKNVQCCHDTLDDLLHVHTTLGGGGGHSVGVIGYNMQYTPPWWGGATVCVWCACVHACVYVRKL